MLLDHVERYIAAQRATGRGHSDIACRRPRRNRGFNKRVRNNLEACRDSVERDAGGSGESLAKNGASLPDFASSADEGHEGAEAHVQTECGATANPAQPCGTVKDPIRGLCQTP